MSTIITLGVLPGWFIRKYLDGYTLETLEDSRLQPLLSALDSSAVALIARGSLPITERVLRAGSGLRAIGRTGVGYDSIDIAAATRLGIPVLYTPGAMSLAVAEHTVAMILAACKDLREGHNRVLEGRWESRYSRLNRDLRGATVGIVGFGRIGSQVWRLLKAFGVRGLVADPYIDPAPLEGEHLKLVSLETLLAESDIVTLHTPLNRETQGLINRTSMECFRPGAILVNAARGRLIESYDLIHAALESGRLAMVALDTLIEEPPETGHPLFRHPGLLVSGHVAARTRQAQEAILTTLGEDLSALLRGEEPRIENVVNPEVLRKRSHEPSK